MIENLINMLTSLLLALCPGCPEQPADCHCTQLFPNADRQEFVDAVVQGTQVISLGGSPQTALDVVFIGDGFSVDSLHVFEDSVDAAIKAIRAMEPYSDYPCAFNFYRVNVISEDNGVDRPYTGDCNSSALNFQFGDPPDPSVPDNEECIAHDQLLITYTRELCYYAAEAATDDWDFIVVLVNDEGYGGGAWEDSAVSSIGRSKFHQLITHEIAHTGELGRLADEYGGGGPYPSDEDPVGRPNVTKDTQLNRIKWRNRITVPSSAIPTPDSYLGGMSPHEVLRVVGLFEGGDGYDTGVYHPQYWCHMHYLSSEFCKVCRTAITNRLLWACEGTVLTRGWPRAEESFIGVEGLIVRWIMRCPHCSFGLPPRGYGNVIIRVEMETSTPADLRVTDQYGEIVRSGTDPTGSDLIVSAKWVARPFMHYYLELRPSSPETRAVDVNSRIWINTTEMVLR